MPYERDVHSSELVKRADGKPHLDEDFISPHKESVRRTKAYSVSLVKFIAMVLTTTVTKASTVEKLQQNKYERSQRQQHATCQRKTFVAKKDIYLKKERR